MARRSTPAAVVQPEPAPEAGHSSAFSGFSDSDLIARNLNLEDQVKAAQKKLDEWAKPLKAEIAEIESALFARLKERGADSTRTDAGTAYISTIMNTKVESREALFDYIAENWRGAVTVRVADDYGSTAKDRDIKRRSRRVDVWLYGSCQD